MNFSRSFIYTTALPFILTASIRAAYQFLPMLDNERSILTKRVQFFKTIVQTASMTRIQPINIPGNIQAKAIANSLLKKGFDVRAITSPTVKRGREILRICLHSYNSE